MHNDYQQDYFTDIECFFPLFMMQSKNAIIDLVHIAINKAKLNHHNLLFISKRAKTNTLERLSYSGPKFACSKYLYPVSRAWGKVLWSSYSGYIHSRFPAYSIVLALDVH